MEILSVGDKIKRARIHKRMTLKDVCGNKISVSKMSCIENNKIKPEYWILEYLSDKLDVDIDYLKQNIRNQIADNIGILSKGGIPDFVQKVEYNLEFAENYRYYDLCFEIMHLQFGYYIDKSQLSMARSNIPEYYKYLEKSCSLENIVLYYMDIGLLLLRSKEYIQAVSYYDNAISISRKIDNVNIDAMYYKEYCLIKMKKYSEACIFMNHIMIHINYLTDSVKKAVVYGMKSVLCLIYRKEDFLKYEEKAYGLLGQNLEYISMLMLGYASTMFTVNMKNSALEYVDKVLDVNSLQNHIDREKVYIILDIINKLIENNFMGRSLSICNIALDKSIILNDAELMERCYYYKAVILEKQGNTKDAEIYMDISLGLLLKFSDTGSICKRHIEMGSMYYRNGKLSESIKCFNYAIYLKDRSLRIYMK
ncbi:MAG: helix-turn-helix domain-containing protein [Clostridium sp.]|jgi:tetratricopeptide (TPR) repeat protein|uniref:helix-turn-helix domain-containing protein n=1 Tax=Clostridium sp. TaxID=1506 RepID=UPI0025C2BCDB|nr:helix-turn-helix transcriptional regulator [Clostridium sp.]MCH3965004.1 helix-turn-helix domain-containing protein [Clostridium sp.]MCI1714225.1 helix-turn-helix domain-containing protein [Clostridium sp.]MCI1798487.1 helix-turn-helix domain-containing protein [Clostridium sp.]MCI1812782.1 helix-turn-helix domain-containing protein [Clostridium sp.]MCI1869296.1 helix-turn-helix domain-containing protein [Clostridium sp.]